MIDARSLHAWLNAGRKFAGWLQARIKDYGFVEGQDFYPVWGNLPKAGVGRRRCEYLLTLDMAKELAMVERTDVGRDTRRYFIQMEKVGIVAFLATMRIRAHPWG